MRPSRNLNQQNMRPPWPQRETGLQTIKDLILKQFVMLQFAHAFTSIRLQCVIIIVYHHLRVYFF